MGIPYAEVIGDPIAHSKSPLIHNFWLEKLGLEANYRPCLVRPAELGDYFEARSRDGDWRGCSITMPHKVAALRYVHKPRDPSFPVEPINAAARGRTGSLEGVNTDFNGLFDPLHQYAGNRMGGSLGPAVVVGAGGVLYPAMTALAALGYAPIWIAMRDPAKMAQVASDYKGVHGIPIPLSDPLPPARLLINASPLGMSGFPSFPLSLDSVEEGGIVFDLVYAPVETALLRDARARGLQAIDGLTMLVGQAAVAFQLFFGEAPPREYDGELRERLIA
ncbi:MAG: shikimate dehydrogenase [Sphingomonadales bacterium]|jgi:shikimate dehydrogenase|nr:shikimate dehydrogenase [Sphingomonadales bacterium]